MGSSRARFASALAVTDDVQAAVTAAADEVDAGLDGPPDVLFPFLRASDPNDYRRLTELLRARFPSAIQLGCSAASVIGGGHEEEDRAALALTAARLAGTTLRLVHLDPDAITVDGAISAERLAATLAVPEGSSPDALVLVDPFSLEPDALVSALDVALPRSVKLGALASAGPVPRSTMLYGEVAHRRGALVLLLDGVTRLRPLVAQGCRPIGRPHMVTRVDEQAVLELDGRPAVEALQKLFAELSASDRDIFRHSLFVGIEMNKGSVEVQTDHLLVRNLLGVNPATGSIGVAASIATLDVIHFVLRDSTSAELELRTLLAAAVADGAKPEGALLFSCVGRGRHLFGRKDHDPDLCRDAFGPLAIGGFFASGEIAPVGGRTFLHGYTSAFALFEPR